MSRKSLLTLVTFVVFVGSLMSHRVLAEVAGGSVSSASGAATQTRELMRYLDLGTAHTCVVLDNNTLKCWGLGSSGQLGYGATATLGDGAGEMGDALAAIDFGTGRSATMIATGASHSCALLDNSTVKCWGLGTDGRLGYGASTSLGRTTGQMGDALGAISLGTGRTAVAISAGASHTCALLDNSTVKCWGLNTDGQLGLGDTDSRGDDAGEMGDVLGAVSLGTNRTVVAVSAGGTHSCALLDNATIKCWGGGAFGQLGIGSVDSIGDGAGEMGDALGVVSLGTGRTAKAVSAGDAHSCAILDNNTVKCWGGNGNGRLGYGDTDDRGDAAGEMGDALSAVSLGTGRTAISISAGAGHTCALLDNSTVKCWGRGLAGRLGVGTSSDMGDASGEMGDTLAAIDLGIGRTAKAVSAGDAHSCVILDDFTVKCWGSGSNGRLGTGATLNLGDESSEMGNALNALSLGTSRTINAITEPARVSALSATSGDAQISLSWTAPSTGGTAITDYRVEYSANSGTTWTVFVDGVATVASATVTGLTNDTAYLFRVTALNSIGVGASSAASSAVTPTTTTTTSTTSTTSTTTTTTTTTTVPTTTTTPQSSGASNSSSAATTVPTTTITTITNIATVPTTTTTTITNIATVPITTTTTVLEPIVRQFVVRSFAPLSAKLLPDQLLKLNKFSHSLASRDVVTCVGFAGDGPTKAMQALARQRAQNVCRSIARVSTGVSIKIGRASLRQSISKSARDSTAGRRKVVITVKSG